MEANGNEQPRGGPEESSQAQKDRLFGAIKNLSLNRGDYFKLDSGDEYFEVLFSKESITDKVWGESYDEFVLRYAPLRLVWTDIGLESASLELIRRSADSIVYSRSLFLSVCDGKVEHDIVNEIYKEEELQQIFIGETEARAVERLINAYNTEQALGLKTLTEEMAAEAIDMVELMANIDKN